MDTLDKLARKIKLSVKLEIDRDGGGNIFEASRARRLAWTAPQRTTWGCWRQS